MLDKNFSYLEPYINTKEKSWFVGYGIKYPNDKTRYRKERGTSFELKIGKNLNNANKILGMVRHYLSIGVDPIEWKDHIRIQQREIFKKRINFDEALELMIDHKGWRNPTKQQDISAKNVPLFLKNFLKPYLIRISKFNDITKVTRQDLNAFIEENFNRDPSNKITKGRKKRSSNGWSSATAKHNKRLLSLLFKVLVEKDFIDVNPALNVLVKSDREKINKVKRRDPHAPWQSEEKDLLFRQLQASTNQIDLNIWMTAHLIYSAFLRKSEVLRFKISWINFNEKQLWIPAIETKSERKYDDDEIIKLNINQSLIDTLRLYIEKRFPKGYNENTYLIFKNDASKPLEYRTLDNEFAIVRNRLKKLNVEGCLFKTGLYSLKHTGVINLYRALRNSGKPLEQLQTILQSHCRHSDWSETANYLRKRCHIDLESKFEMIEF